VNVLERGDHALLEMDARLVESTRVAFEKYLFAEQVELLSRVGYLHEISLLGPGAREILKDIAGGDVPELESLGSTSIQFLNTSIAVWRDDIAGVPGYHLIFDAGVASRIWQELLARYGEATDLGRRRLRAAGWAAFNATRIEAGRPLFGIDFDDSVLPHETGQIARAVSFTKGCYLGQEIVARMQARGQFARQIVGIKMAEDVLPIAGAIIQDDKDNQIGGVTSSTVSPVLSGAAVCLGIVRKQFTPVGTVLNIPAEGQMRKGTVVELPFIK
jgi:aminomethyltransferase